MKRIIAPLAALLFSSSVYAQQVNTAELDRLLDSLTAHNKSMSSVLMTHQGAKIYERAIGYAVIDSARQMKATPATRYRIGSVTKTFTATMIMQLVEAGKLSMSTHLDKYFPQIPNAKSITIEMMLRHRSGIHNFTDDDAFWASLTQPKSRGEMLATFASSKSDFNPDAETRYSNTNYVLLGYIVEDITKKSYAKNLQERIAGPLGLKNTTFGGKTDPSHGDAFSYTFSDRWNKETETDVSQTGGAGGIVSTPEDVIRFMQSLLGGKLVSSESLRAMTKIADGMGMGLAVTPFYQHKGFGHTGKLDGFQTSVAYFPDDSLGIAIFSNGVDYAVNDIVIAALSTYYRMPFTIPDFRLTEVSPEVMDQYAGIYSSQQIPLKLTVSRKDKNLLVQATGQPALRLTPVEKDVFKYDAAGVTVQFKPQDNSLTLLQGGQVFQFKR